MTRAWACLTLSLCVAMRAAAASDDDDLGESIKVSLTRELAYDGSILVPQQVFYAMLRVGSSHDNNGLSLRMTLDTASENTWLPATKSFWSCDRTNLHYSNGYDASLSASSECRDPENKVAFDYKGTRLEGWTYDDLVHLYADLGNPNERFKRKLSFKHNFLAASEASNAQFASAKFDGVVGLAPSDRSLDRQESLLVNLNGRQRRESDSRDHLECAFGSKGSEHHAWIGGRPNRKVFALWFRDIANEVDQVEELGPIGGVAEAAFGAIDCDKFFYGQMIFHRLVKPDEWALSLNGISYEGEHIDLTNEHAHLSIDSTDQWIWGPREAVEQLYGLLQANYNEALEVWSINDCERLDSMGPLVFEIEGRPWAVQQRHYVRRMLLNFELHCYLALMPWDKPHWKVGTSFLGQFYTVFDAGRKLVGLAYARQRGD